MFSSLRTGKRRTSVSSARVQLYQPVDTNEKDERNCESIDEVQRSGHDEVQSARPSAPIERQALALEGHVGSLDGLRGVACIFAMLHHIELTPAFVGHYGVTMFFVLSGFLISGILVNARAKITRRSDVWPYLSTFYSARAVRLMPAQLVLVAGTYAWLKYMNAAHYTDSMLTQAYVRVLSSTEDFKSAHHPLQNCWSLAVEEWSYVFLSVLMLVLPTSRSGRLIALATIVVSFFAVKVYMVTSQASEHMFEWQKHSYLGFPPLNVHWEFGFMTNAWKIFTGAIFRLTPWPTRFSSSPTLSVLLTITIVAIVELNGDYLLARGWSSTASRSILVDPFVTLLTGLVIVTSLHGNVLLELPSLRYVGRISYSLYLWQWPIIDSINWGNGKWAKAGATGLAFIVAHLSTTYVEEPILRVFRRWKAKKHVAAT